jgi:hypothetical protein|tara:strand:+ start:244 stop:405 length:162 start_codon:yes stop_codon:yes gene_type:complete
MPISYLEFKLHKEMTYQDTFGKDEKIREEYKEYIKQQKKERKKDEQARKSNIL